MQPATQDSVLGDFDNTHFDYAGTRTRFSQENGQFFVQTDGRTAASTPSRRLHPAITRCSNISSNCRAAAAAFIAWDSRSKSEGGQRSFHLYPDQTLRAGHPLH